MKNIVAMTCIVKATCDMIGVLFGEYYSTENVRYWMCMTSEIP